MSIRDVGPTEFCANTLAQATQASEVIDAENAKPSFPSKVVVTFPGVRVTPV